MEKIFLRFPNALYNLPPASKQAVSLRWHTPTPMAMTLKLINGEQEALRKRSEVKGIHM